jgi:predicted nucleotidyltransferase
MAESAQAARLSMFQNLAIPCYMMDQEMLMSAIRDPVLERFRHSLDAVYGKRIERVVLFGSRARGEARPESDYDVAVFIKDPGELWDELGNLSHITTDILNETGAVISAKPFRADAYNDRSPLMGEIRNDGRDL